MLEPVIKIPDGVSPLPLHHADVVRESHLDPPIESPHHVHPPVVPKVDQSVVSQQVPLGLDGPPLQHNGVVPAGEDPEAEDGDVDADLDGGVQAAGLAVVEVAADARAQRAANSLAQLKEVSLECIVCGFQISKKNK